MKKSIFITFLLVAFAYTAQAQEISPNALGLRLGDGNGFGAEVSYQRALGMNNRLELDLGLRSDNNFDGFSLAGLYQWVWLLDGNFNWYAGVGGGIASYDYKPDFPGYSGSETFLFGAGDIGIEYNFDIPLQLSLDARPEFAFGSYNDNLDFDIALSIRYRF